MVHRVSRYKPSIGVLCMKLLLLSCLFLVGGISVQAAQDDPPQLPASLRLVAEDADLYYVADRLQLQFEHWSQQKWVQRLQATQVWKQALEAIRKDWNENESLAPMRTALKTPAARELLAFGKDLVSQEAFFLGTDQFAPSYRSFMELERGLSDAVEPQIPEILFDWIATDGKELLRNVTVPTMVLGFRFSRENKALDFIDQVQGLASFLPGNVGTVLQRVEDRRGTRLVLQLEGSMIPFDALMGQGVVEGADEALIHLRDALQDQRCVLTCGILDQFFVFAISQQSDAISQLGSKSPLLDTPLLEPVRAHPQPITFLSHQSDAMAAADFEIRLNNFFMKNVYPFLADSFAYEDDPFDSGNTFPILDSLEEDLAWLDDEIKQHVPKYQGALAFASLVEHGMQGVQLPRTKPVLLDGTQPLSILEHCGKDPFLLLARRHQYHPEWFQLSRKVVKHARKYVELAITEGWLDEADTREWTLMLKEGYPILNSLADLIEQKFLPVTKPGQFAWVLTEGATMDPSPFLDHPYPTDANTPLRLPAFAWLCETEDASKMIDGWIGIFSVLDRSMALAAQLAPDVIPSGLSIPRPSHQQSTIAERYLYTFPAEWHLPSDLAPQACFEGPFFLSSFSDQQMTSLRSQLPLEIADGGLNRQEACAGFAYLDAGRLAKWLTPWVRFGLESAKSQGLLDPLSDLSRFPVTFESAMECIEAFHDLGRWESTTHLQPNGSLSIHWSYRE